MADEPTAAQPPPRHRRSSFAGQTFADLFGTSRSSTQRTSAGTGSNSPPPPQHPGPITTAAAQAQQRRLSLTTLGLAGSPGSTPPFNSLRGRRDSDGSANSGSIDESAIEDDGAKDVGSGTTPSTPFARRMSFGAKALRDVRNAGGGGGSPGQNGTRSPPAVASSAGTAKPPNGTISARDAKGRGPSEGFNWSDNFRTRAERTSIASGQGPGPGPVPQAAPFASSHSRAKSVAIMEPPGREIPRGPQRPDHFQERILKGDFYMD